MQMYTYSAILLAGVSGRNHGSSSLRRCLSLNRALSRLHDRLAPRGPSTPMLRLGMTRTRRIGRRFPPNRWRGRVGGGGDSVLQLSLRSARETPLVVRRGQGQSRARRSRRTGGVIRVDRRQGQMVRLHGRRAGCVTREAREGIHGAETGVVICRRRRGLRRH